jgi:hypothetical protein
MQAHTGKELSGRRRFRYVVISAGRECFYFASFVIALGECDYGQLIGCRLSPQKLAQSQPIDAGYFEIQNNQVTALVIQGPQSPRRVACRQGLIAGVLEDVAQSFARGGIVVNN